MGSNERSPKTAEAPMTIGVKCPKKRLAEDRDPPFGDDRPQDMLFLRSFYLKH